MQAIRRALFIDGSNLYAAAKNLGFDIDYGKLRYFFESGAWLVRAYYYTAIAEDQEYSPVRPLADWLDYNGFTLVSKPAREYVDATGRRRIRGNMDVEIAVDALNLADRIDHMVLISGDGDFRRLIEAMQAKGVKVTVVSTIRTSPPMASDDVRRQADEFLDLLDIAPEIERGPGSHPLWHPSQQKLAPNKDSTIFWFFAENENVELSFHIIVCLSKHPTKSNK